MTMLKSSSFCKYSSLVPLLVLVLVVLDLTPSSWWNCGTLAFQFPNPLLPLHTTTTTTTTTTKNHGFFGITTTTTIMTSTSIYMTSSDENDPTTFREAEILGLRCMQQGDYASALIAFEKGMTLPGSRLDVVRTKSLSGPSPVGGAFGGTESTRTQSLDDFELQAAHYNMACAHARLGNVPESIANLAKAFENGFDNYSTVRGDPDLEAIQNEPDFEQLLQAYEKNNNNSGFNPFGFFGGSTKK